MFPIFLGNPCKVNLSSTNRREFENVVNFNISRKFFWLFLSCLFNWVYLFYFLITLYGRCNRWLSLVVNCNPKDYYRENQHNEEVKVISILFWGSDVLVHFLIWLWIIHWIGSIISMLFSLLFIKGIKNLMLLIIN